MKYILTAKQLKPFTITYIVLIVISSTTQSTKVFEKVTVKYVNRWATCLKKILLGPSVCLLWLELSFQALFFQESALKLGIATDQFMI